jgi:hypothetical protein
MSKIIVTPVGIAGKAQGETLRAEVVAVTRNPRSALYQYALHAETAEGEAIINVLNRFQLSPIDGLIGKREYIGEGRHQLPERLPASITWLPRHVKATDCCWHLASLRRRVSVPGRGLQAYDVIEHSGRQMILRDHAGEKHQWLAEVFTGNLFVESDAPATISVFADDVYSIERPNQAAVRPSRGWI